MDDGPADDRGPDDAPAPGGSPGSDPGPTDGHDHGAIPTAHRSRRRLLVVAAAMATVAAVEVAAGLWANSLALLSDAAHAGFDALAMALAFGAVHLAVTRPPDQERTFGYHRSEVLAALVNGLALWLVAGYIALEAWRRAQTPGVIAGDVVTYAAVAILAVEAAAGAYLLRGEGRGNLNVKGATAHLLGDVLGTVGVLISGLVVTFTGFTLIDPLVAAGIAAALALYGARLVRAAGHILLQGAPDHMPADEVRRAILDVDGVAGVHDLHVWSITQGVPTVSAHVVCADDAPPGLHARVQRALEERFGCEHVTLQVEDPDHACAEPAHP